MVYLRLKKVKQHYYAYLIKNEWDKGKKQARQKTIKYIGRIQKDNKVSKIDLNKCAKCGTTENLTADHVIPLARNGTHDISNLQCLCLTCNQRKGKS